MSTVREALEALGAEVTLLEEHVAKSEGHLVQLRENIHDLKNFLNAVSLNVEQIVVQQEKDGKLIRGIHANLGSLIDLIRTQHSENAARSSQLEARIRAVETR